ncbi:hypothetical protein Ancab_016356 [Ancistrocladus abbreviatus]
MEAGDDGTVKLGRVNMKPDRYFDLASEVSVSSLVTRQQAEAAKQFIENHYKNYLQGLQDRQERWQVANGPAYWKKFSPPLLLSGLLAEDLLGSIRFLLGLKSLSIWVELLP